MATVGLVVGAITLELRSNGEDAHGQSVSLLRCNRTPIMIFILFFFGGNWNFYANH